ncbi:hypothetical protein BJ742DRAFT_826024 [Cladochytrium replicatum]|nr:hypothetical protein BJ742DRAFT_826024 [Cladochytrium replicatum]
MQQQQQLYSAQQFNNPQQLPVQHFNAQQPVHFAPQSYGQPQYQQQASYQVPMFAQQPQFSQQPQYAPQYQQPQYHQVHQQQHQYIPPEYSSPVQNYGVPPGGLYIDQPGAAQLYYQQDEYGALQQQHDGPNASPLLAAQPLHGRPNVSPLLVPQPPPPQSSQAVPHLPQRRVRPDLGVLSPTSSIHSDTASIASNVSGGGSLGSYIPPRRHTVKPDTDSVHSHPHHRHSTAPPDVAPGFSDNNSIRDPRRSVSSGGLSGRTAIPHRQGQTRIAIDDLLEQGNAAFALHSYDEALQKWKRAAEQAAEEGDLIMEAKAHSNWSCALRAMGVFDEALAHVQWAWRRSCRYIEGASASPWIDLITHYVEITEADSESPLSPEFGMSALRRHVSVNSDYSSSSNGATQAQLGPPIVVWFMELATNYGNAIFCIGNLMEAVHWHDIALRLGEAVMDEFQLPQTVAINLGAQINRTTSVKSTTDEGDPATTSKSQLPPRSIKFSYVHRATLLALTRSLTHIGVCYQYLSKPEEAFHCQTRASQILQFYLSHHPNHTSTPSLGALSKTSVTRTNTSSSSGSTVHNGNPAPADKPNPGSKIQHYAASVLSNLGTAYYARSLLPVALDRHIRAARMFGDLDDKIRFARQNANVRVLEIEAGRRLSELEWGVNRAFEESQGAKRSSLGPPRLPLVNYPVGVPDERAGLDIAVSVYERSLGELAELAGVFAKSGDFLGETMTRMNVASVYKILQHPEWAFHVYAIIASTMETPLPTPPSDVPATPSTPNQVGELTKNRLPKWLYPSLYVNMYITLMQLERIQFEKLISLENFTPRGQIPPGQSSRHVDLYPYGERDVAYVSKLLRHVDGKAEVPDLRGLSEGSTEMLGTFVRDYVDSVVASATSAAGAWESSSTALNVPVVEDDSDGNAADELGLGLHTAAMRGWEHAGAVGSRSNLISAVLSISKAKWVHAVGLMGGDGSELVEVAKVYCHDAVSELTRIVELPLVSSEGENGPIQGVVETVVEEVKKWGSSGPAKGWEIEIGRSGVVGLVGDLLGYCVAYNPGMLETLGISTDEEGLDHRGWCVRGKVVLSAGALGICEGCVASLLEKVQGGEDFGRMYSGRSGVGKRESRDAVVVGVGAHGAGKWPCAHFPWHYFVLR